MKKRIIAMVLATTTVFALVGCGGKTTETTEGSNTSTSTSEKEKITVWAWDPNFNIAIMNEAKAIYETENKDVEIEVIDFARADVEQKLHTMLTAGTTKDLPEIVLIEDYNAQKFLQSYPGSFEDLTGKIPYDKFVDYKKEFMMVDGKTYGVPFDSGVAGLYYRTDILEQAGFTEADLENITWDRYIEIGKVVKEKTGKSMLSIDPNDLGLVRIMLNGAGSWFYDEEGNPNLANNDILKKALITVKTMIDSGIANVQTGWADFLKGFNSGEVVTVPTGVWITPSIEQESSQSGLWKVAPIPRLDVPGAVNASNLGGSSWYILSKSESKDAAVEFMNSVYTNEDFYQTILDKNGAVASYVPSMDGEAYKKEKEFFGGQAIYEDFTNWMKEVPSVDFGMYTYEIENILVAAFTDILSGKSIDESLKSVEEQVKMQIQ